MSEPVTSGHALVVVPYGSDGLSSSAYLAFEGLRQHLVAGRQGHPWCRWAVYALDTGTFYVSDGRGLALETLEQIVKLLADTFVALSETNATQNKNQMTLTLLIDSKYSSDAMEHAVQDTRRTLLERGLMVGVLHPRSELFALSEGPPGVPYRTAACFITVRWAVRADTLFVSGNPILEQLLDEWLQLQAAR